MSTGKGSFASREKIEEKIRQDRAEAQSTDAEDSASTESTEETAKEREEAGLPEKVMCGAEGKEIAFDEFRVMYTPIFDAIRDKVHLSRGWVDYGTQVAGQRVRIRTLTTGEQKFVSYMSKATNSGFSSSVDQDEFYRWSLMFSLTDYGAQNVSVSSPPRVFSNGPLSDPSADEAEEYTKKELVSAKLKLLDDMPYAVYDRLIGVMVDVFFATQLAIREDMVNP